MPKGSARTSHGQMFRWPAKENVSLSQTQGIIVNAWKPRQRSSEYIRNVTRRFFSFLVCRHPLERILSAYRLGNSCRKSVIINLLREKFFLNGDSSYERFKVGYWYRNHGEHIISRYRKTVPTDLIYKNAPTFREFIEYLVDLPISKFDVHWIPIYLQCMPCHINYRIVAKFDTLTIDSDRILKALNISVHLTNAHITQNKTTDNTVASYYSTITTNLLGKLYDIYKFDFLLFIYTLDEYVSYVQ
jgi:chondroitin 4-sulfotransferase 11